MLLVSWSVSPFSVLIRGIVSEGGGEGEVPVVMLVEGLSSWYLRGREATTP